MKLFLIYTFQLLKTKYSEIKIQNKVIRVSPAYSSCAYFCSFKKHACLRQDTFGGNSIFTDFYFSHTSF